MSEFTALQQRSIPFSGTITRAEFSLVQRLLLPWWGSLWMTAFFIFLLALIFDVAGDVGDSMLERTLFNLVWAAAMFLLVWVLTRLVQYQQWRQVKVMKQSISGSIGEGGIEWNTPLTTANFPWQNIVKLRQHPDMLLFFYSARCAFYVPKTFFATETAWNDANVLALRSLSAKSRRS